MAATSRGIVSAGSLQDRRIEAAFTRASSTNSRTRVQIKGLMTLATAPSFRAFRTIRKSSPRLTRSTSRRLMNRSWMRLTTTTTTAAAALPPDQMNNSFRIPKTPKEDDVMRKFNSSSQDDVAGDENSDESLDPASAMVDTVNAVLADVVDAQKFIKETGRTQPRPMKRRQLVVSLALGGLRGPMNDVESRLGSFLRRRSASRLSRTPSTGSGFARTAHLVSQLSFDGSSPHSAAELH